MNSYNNNDHTPLMIATVKGYIEIVKLLVGVGVEINNPDRNGQTPLLKAVENDNIELVELLLGANACYTYGDIDGNSILMYAVMNGNIEIVKLLLDKGRGRPYRLMTNTNDVYKVDGNANDVCKVDSNAIDVNNLNDGRDTALMMTYEKKHVEIIFLLMAAGAELDTDLYSRYIILHEELCGKSYFSMLVYHY